MAQKWKIFTPKRKQRNAKLLKTWWGTSILIYPKHSPVHFSIDPTQYEACQKTHGRQCYNLHVRTLPKLSLNSLSILYIRCQHKLSVFLVNAVTQSPQLLNLTDPRWKLYGKNADSTNGNTNFKSFNYHKPITHGTSTLLHLMRWSSGCIWSSGLNANIKLQMAMLIGIN